MVGTTRQSLRPRNLNNEAPFKPLVGLVIPGQEGQVGGSLKDLLYALTGQSCALQIAPGANLLS